ncbi:MAG: tetratricopeptide repeat protein [Vicinamibacteria bacterium]|nr:tetratricopeptide repeat protein [Vicinamibacteria bacterium]
MPQQPFALYNPALLQPDDLLAQFTARLPLLETLLGVIRGNKAGQPPQHCLLIGARGMGKTTTLWAVAHRVNRDATLACDWQPVVFDEESRRVGDLADFWLECIRQWEHVTQSPGALADHLLADAPADIEDRAREAFLRLLDQSRRRALLLIDNLNDVLSSISDPEPLHRLRAFLMQDSRVMVVGGATRYFDEITSVDQPFYDFFRCFELRPLTAEETEACLLALAKNRGGDSIERIEKTLQERQGTVRALHLLTGGNPRLVKTFYRLLAEGLRGDIRAELERLMDEFTPYFKAIVDALPVQQQRIFDAVALAWDPVEVASLATATRLPSNQVSAQLRSLVRTGFLREGAGGPKRKTYLLADRFSNIHYLMRHGRAARNRLDWFVALVRIVFPDRASAEVLARAAREAAECGPEGLLDARSVLHSALSRAESGEDRRALMHATLREGWDSKAWESLDEWFDAARAQADLPEVGIIGFCKTMPEGLRKKLGYKPDHAVWWYQLTDFLEEKEAWSVAEAAYRRAIELDAKYASPWNGLGNLLQDHLGRPSEADTAYRKAIELDPKWAHPWIGLGNLLQDHLDRPGEAEAAYRRAIELDPKWAHPWISLGNLLQDHLDRPGEAEAAYRRAIELDPKSAYPWNNLGNALQSHLGQPAEAEAAYRKAIELDPMLAYPWNGVGSVLAGHLGRPAEAEGAFRKAIELDPKYVDPWNGLGNVLQVHLGRPAEAEAVYRKAIELDPKYPHAWSGLAKALSRLDGRREEARAYALNGLSLNPKSRFARHMFIELCGDRADDWRAALPALVAWCLTHPKADDVFDFTVDGLLRLARLTKPAEALSLQDSLTDATPFQTVRDAFVAHDHRDHLQTLAPERQTIVLALLDRLAPAQPALEAKRTPAKAKPAKKK